MTKRLHKSQLKKNPFEQFGQWFREASRQKSILLPEAFCVSSVDAEGYPSSRMVLLKSFDKKGFVFYTNYNSPKARSLMENPKAALNFYWSPLGRQVRIQGKASQTSPREADLYFKTRPRLSQLSAWASQQSEVLDSYSLLEEEMKRVETLYKGKPVPRPPHWSGFRIVPSSLEFWQEGGFRLHDRFLYTKNKGRWIIQRLYP